MKFQPNADRCPRTWHGAGASVLSMKFVLIVVWFGFPQQQQSPDFSSIAWGQPLGVAMQEFDDRGACEAQAKRFTSPYIDATCAAKGSAPSFSQRDPNPDELPTVR